MTDGPILPTDDEASDLVARPDSIVWRRVSDPCAYLVAGYALVLQVAHPTVGAGVRDHSRFDADPWGRLWRTLDYVNLSVYGGARAVDVGRRLREMHKHISGVHPDGTRYHALEPGAYAWVHATLVEAVVTAHNRFGRPLGHEQIEQLYQEWLLLGRLVGVRSGDLPGDWTGFRAYFDEMVRDCLVRNETVDRVLRTLYTDRSPIPALGPLWRLARYPTGHLLWLGTAGTLAPVLRERFGLPWTRANALEYRAVSAAARATHPLLPGPLRVTGPRYLRWRRREIAGGPFGAGHAPSRVA